MKRFGPLLCALGAVLLWLSSRMTWVTAHSEDDKSGPATNDIVGATWSLELTAVALVLLAGAVAALAVPPLARRIIGIICAVAAAIAAWQPINLLLYGADNEQAQHLLSAAKDNDKAVDAASISDWAVVTETAVSHAGPFIALVGATAAIVGGVMIAVNPGTRRGSTDDAKYKTPAARQEQLPEDLAEDPDSERVMWDALDSGIDPTDLPQER